jgi:hypothetical protein
MMNANSCEHSACLVLLVDQSVSLGTTENGPAEDVGRIIADTVNTLLSQLLENVPDPSLVAVALIAYNTDELAVACVSPVGRTGLAGTPGFVVAAQLPELAGPAEKPCWLRPEARGGTPMCQALRECQQRLATWIGQHPQGRAPVVLHFTDGHCRDGNPLPLAEQLEQLGTSQGKVVLLNFRIAAAGDRTSRTMFAPDPDFVSAQPKSGIAAVLFAMSSQLSAAGVELAQTLGIADSPCVRGLAYNVAAHELGEFCEFALALVVGLPQS